jgi:transketolase
VETAAAWQSALLRSGPTSLLLSRQALAFQERTAEQIKNIARGGYVLIKEKNNTPDIILIATGSEISLAVAASAELKTAGIDVRVVSMPSIDVFLSQDNSYQEEVLPKEVSARIAIEAAASLSWHQFVGLQGKIIGLDRFGASAPMKDVYRDCGFTVEHVVAAAKEVLNTKHLSSII